jgi:magnesium chelatase family protein
MLARVYSCAVIGFNEVVVEVDFDYISGMPSTTSVGLPNAAVRNTGVPYPRKRLVVNLALAAGGLGGYDQPGAWFADLLNPILFR